MPGPEFPHLPSEEPSEEDSLIQFFSEDVDFELVDSIPVSKWLLRVIVQEGKELNALSFIFCSDEYLLRLNTEYLQHDTYTDVITFPYAEGPVVEGDIFISVERVKENALVFQSAFDRELCRVMVHGVMHLCGYGDKTPEEQSEMREKENEYIRLWEEIA